MNREILFRGFQEDENGNTTIYVDGRAVKGKWVEGLPGYDINGQVSEIQHFDSPAICVLVDVIPSTVGQYTGLTDKNGKKIFDGDKAEGIRFKDKETGIIRHNHSMACFEFMVKHCDGHINSCLIGHCNSIEVTGTIWDKEKK